ncbi:MAG: asparagine--tRNA ligase [Parcubacteria group bacterium]|nr:asparagine--tRNA ligase [Parcubacteria group bacterium]
MIIFLSSISKHSGETITVRGWVANFRSSGKIYFLEIRDGSGFIQAIADQKALSAEQWETIQSISLESSVEVTGIVTKHPKRDEYEVQIKEVKLIQRAEEYPIGKKEHGPDFLLDNRHLWLRSPKQWAIQRIRNTIINATYEFLNDRGFIKLDAPILTPTFCEGTTELFEIDYFGEKAYLTQSGQLYLEGALAAFGKVFDFGPVFRAEKSKTRRHLIEFWMMDAEAAFVEYKENLEIQEQLVSCIVQKVLRDNGKELAMCERAIGALEKIKAPFYRIDYNDAIKELHASGSDIKEGDDLGADDETLLTQKYDKPIFIERYPSAIKAFYMKNDPDDPSRVLNADLLAPEGYGEIIGGSQREENLDALLRKMKQFNVPIDKFQWYIDTRRYGTVPHSGFGYGLERIVAWICGLHHVRETIPFPRMLKRMYP